MAEIVLPFLFLFYTSLGTVSDVVIQGLLIECVKNVMSIWMDLELFEVTLNDGWG